MGSRSEITLQECATQAHKLGRRIFQLSQRANKTGNYYDCKAIKMKQLPFELIPDHGYVFGTCMTDDPHCRGLRDFDFKYDRVPRKWKKSMKWKATRAPTPEACQEQVQKFNWANAEFNKDRPKAVGFLWEADPNRDKTFCNALESWQETYYSYFTSRVGIIGPDAASMASVFCEGSDGRKADFSGACTTFEFDAPELPDESRILAPDPPRQSLILILDAVKGQSIVNQQGRRLSTILEEDDNKETD